MQKFQIQELCNENLDDLMQMLKEFAQYEGMQKDLKCTKKALKNFLLENKIARGFILKEYEEIIGYMIYFYTFSSFWGSGGIYIEDLYIRKDYRKKGYGRQVFKFLGAICKKEKLERLDWVCLNENILGIRFYESFKATHLKQWRIYRLSGKNLAKLCE